MPPSLCRMYGGHVPVKQLPLPSAAVHMRSCSRAVPPRATAANASDGPSALAVRLASLLGAASVSFSCMVAQPGPAAGKALMTGDELHTVQIFRTATPSVVNVTNLAKKRDTYTLNMMDVPQGAGSGFVWDDEGHVVTNMHVVEDASDLQVTLLGGNEYKATVVGMDPDKDIAVLKITPDAQVRLEDSKPKHRPGAAIAATLQPQFGPLRPMNLCPATSSSDLIVGQHVFAIGNPFGLDHTLTTGVVSGIGREILGVSGRPIQDVVQTDAAINPGNSGGPLLDSGGCLIGVNTAIYSPTGANSGVGFAIPADMVRSTVESIIKYGKVVRPALGISFAPDQSSEQLGFKGILVLHAKEGGPAWRAGMKGTSRDEYGRLVLGDIITGIDGMKVKNSSDLYRLLDQCKVGDMLNIEVLRGDTIEIVSATLEANA